MGLISASGLTGSREIANSMVDNNVGVTVAYTVFALIMQWGACVVFGLSGLGSDQSIRKGEVQRISSVRSSSSYFESTALGYDF